MSDRSEGKHARGEIKTNPRVRLISTRGELINFFAGLVIARGELVPTSPAYHITLNTIIDVVMEGGSYGDFGPLWEEHLGYVISDIEKYHERVATGQGVKDLVHRVLAAMPEGNFYYLEVVMLLAEHSGVVPDALLTEERKGRTYLVSSERFEDLYRVGVEVKLRKSDVTVDAAVTEEIAPKWMAKIVRAMTKDR